MKDDSMIVTGGDLVVHLQKSFSPEDRLCLWDEGGAYMNCYHVLKSMLGVKVCHGRQDSAH